MGARCGSSRIPRSPSARATSRRATAPSARSARDDGRGGGDRTRREGRVRASRHLPILAVLAAIAVVGLRAASTGAADAAGAATPPPVDPACASDDRAFRALVETVRAKSDELARREAEVAPREAGLAQARPLLTRKAPRPQPTPQPPPTISAPP